MQKKFKEVPIFDFNKNIFLMLEKDWMLITAGNQSHFNTMTASWGGFGVLWNKNVAFIFIRPTRYTYQFANEHEFLSLCFFPEKYHGILNYCGTHSGKKVDKIKETGLKPFETSSGAIAFEQASIILECKKLYQSDINPEYFFQPETDKNYPQKDYHRMYICEIVRLLCE